VLYDVILEYRIITLTTLYLDISDEANTTHSFFALMAENVFLPRLTFL
jgi:hypothetical protein